MGLFGKPSKADIRRSQRFKEWSRARSPYAIYSCVVGIVALLDFITPLGLIFGVVAIVLAVRGFRDIKERPQMLGRRLCYTGAVMGSVGFVLSVTVIAVEVFFFRGS